MDVIEIKDPNLNKEEILKQITERIKGKTVPDYATIGPDSLRNTVAETPDALSAGAGNHTVLIDLMLMLHLQEPEFTSETPILGTLIIRLRQLWNWMSTKWYVRPIIKQQSTVNGQIAVLLLEMETWMNEKNKTIAELEAKVNRLESILAANELAEK